jgi:outer membrane protein assembly factor BamD (BamD/ComL family)
VPAADRPDAPEREAFTTQPKPSLQSPAPKTAGAKPVGDGRAQPSAAALFERANRLRRQGQAGAALREYGKLQAHYPSARETRLSHAICGRLHLQLSQPSQALQQFDRYLAGAGAATQDALAGRADAYRQLGDVGRERAAWQRLLRNYPKSVHVQRARSRLKALE